MEEAHTAKGSSSSFGSKFRRRISDITNYLPQSKSSLVLPEKSKSPIGSSSAAKEVDIEDLLKEKMAMIKVIQEKNKIIEMCGVEIQSMMTCIQKLKLQNWSLAQANTHISGELNLNRERLKALQHEIECKEALVRVKSLQDHQEAIRKMSEIKDVDKTEKGCLTSEDDDYTSSRRRGCFSRSRSVGSRLALHSQFENRSEREVLLTKRLLTECTQRCLRRRSINSWTKSGKNQEEKMFEIVHPNAELVSSSNDGRISEKSRRASVSRPLRRAAEKVESYKERPLNTKLRRAG